MSETTTLSVDDADALAMRALTASGTSAHNARKLVDGIIGAELDGISSHGLMYVPIYCEHVGCGKIDGAAEPKLEELSPSAFRVDAASGFAHPAIALGFERLVPAAKANAIAAFEIDAFTFSDSPWDRYVSGNNSVLSEEAKQGALLFYGKANCAGCHAGNLFTDQQHHNIAVPQLGPGKGEEAPLDFGRGRETKNPADRFKFRTPPLRNVALTGPWMHNGAYKSLRETVAHHYLNPEQALRTYNVDQLDPELQDTLRADEDTLAAILETLDESLKTPPPLTEEEVDQLLAFMESLTSPSAFYLPGDIPKLVPSGLPVAD